MPYVQDEGGFSTREVPWMKVGTVIDAPVTAEVAMTKAGLDFDVEKRPVAFRRDGSQGWIEYPGKEAIVRVDTDEPFGIASPDYEIVQYRDAFSFINEISPEIVAAGSLRKQRQAFMVVRVPEHLSLDVVDGDHLDLYGVLRTSHDLTRAIEFSIMPLRGRCMNELPLANFGKNAPQRWSVRHVTGAAERLQEAMKIVRGVDRYAEEFAATAERLAEIDLTLEEAREVLTKVVPQDRPRTEKVMGQIEDLFEHAPTVGYRRTGWGLLNAVSEYHEHYRQGGNAESQFIGALQGSTHRVVNRTAQLLLVNHR